MFSGSEDDRLTALQNTFLGNNRDKSPKTERHKGCTEYPPLTQNFINHSIATHYKCEQKGLKSTKMYQIWAKRGLKTAIFCTEKAQKPRWNGRFFEGCNSDSCSSLQCQLFQEMSQPSQETSQPFQYKMNIKFTDYWLPITSGAYKMRVNKNRICVNYLRKRVYTFGHQSQPFQYKMK